MVHYLIMCRSLTYAQRTAKALERAGITAIVMRPPVELSREGCAYCVKISERRLSDALVTMKRAGLSHRKIYSLYSDGTSKEVLP